MPLPLRLTRSSARLKLSVLCSLSALLLNACQLVPLLTGLPADDEQYVLPPEYEPVQAVMVSEHLATFPNGKQFLQSLLSLNTQVWLLAMNGQALERTQFELQQRFGLQADQLQNLRPLPIATETVWARDWAPLFTYSTTGNSKIGMLDLQYYPDRQVDDAVPSALANLFKDVTRYFGGASLIPNQPFQVLPVQVELEGGNLMCTRQNCFVSEEVLRRLEDQGKNADPEKIKQELEKYLEQRFWIVPRLPIEGTGHIDIWAKFLSKDELIVGQISDLALERVPPEQQASYRELQAFLEEQATGLTASGEVSEKALATVLKQVEPGVKITRIPMPTPGVFQGVETFRTYTNSLLINQTAIVPRYGRGRNSRFQSRELSQEYEQAVAKVYQDAGYKVIWIQADNLIRDGGAWHCVSMQVPVLDSPPQLASR